MNAEEFRGWVQAWQEMPDDDDFWTDMAGAAMRAQLSLLKEAHEIPVRVATEWAQGIAWAGFWLAVGAIGYAAVMRWM